MSDEARYIFVNGWSDFQTYTDKRGKPWVPPWIKIYPRLLDDPGFLALSAADRSLLVGIWMLFANSRGQVTNDLRSLSRRLNQRVTEAQVERLNHAGYIRMCSGTVREQLWNTFRNGSRPEGEVDKNPPTPAEAGEQTFSHGKTKTRRATSDNGSKQLHRALAFTRNAGGLYERLDFEEEIAKYGLDLEESQAVYTLWDEIRANGSEPEPEGELPWEGDEPPVVEG